jgi:hypothetical protein
LLGARADDGLGVVVLLEEGVEDGELLEGVVCAIAAVASATATSPRKTL